MSFENSHTTITPNMSAITTANRAAAQWMLENQQPEGFWVGMLETNSCMEAEWVLMMQFLGIKNDPKYPGVIQSILNEQRSDGSWEVYHDSPGGDINGTVECYAALRASGLPADDERLIKAREWILSYGGLIKTRVFTRYWLALIGEWEWNALPVLPPEMILLPHWFPFSIYNFASWARATIVPLMILSARRPSRPMSPESRLDELFPGGRERYEYRVKSSYSLLSWEGLFRTLDRGLNCYSRFAFNPGRESAIRVAIEWIVRHQEADGAWSGIQPPWVYSLMALHVEGYPLSHPAIAKGLEGFDAHWKFERNGGTYLQASESPVWDTMWSLIALHEAGYSPADNEPMHKGIQWLLDKQLTCKGDWSIKHPYLTGGGWAFQRANTSYPDIDDTSVAMILLALVRDEYPEPEAVDLALQRATDWILALQSSNGGWGSYDRNNNQNLITKIPFCDFGEVLDPPSVDVTAHIIEAFAYMGYKKDHPAMARALQYVLSEQEEDGSWFGRWGVNHIYGTAAVLPALAAIGIDSGDDCMTRAADWIVAHQNKDGGWGETPASYLDDSLRGVGESTASQTGWALMALLALNTHEYDEAIYRGNEFLCKQQEHGTWHEQQYTGTGFPGYGAGARSKNRSGTMSVESLEQGREMSRGFMLNYNLYRHYFPLIALGRSIKHLQ